MREKLHRELLQNIDALQSFLSRYSTETIVGMCTTKFLHLFKDDCGLKSPYKQINYLLGIMLTTPEPSHRHKFGENEWEQAVRLLEDIFNCYSSMFWPDVSKGETFENERKEIIDVAMPSFLHFYNSGLKASTAQVKKRIQRYLIPFNQEVIQLVNISVSKILEITHFIAERIKSDYDSFGDFYEKSDKIRVGVLKKAEKEGWDDDKIHQIVNSGENIKTFKSYYNSLQDLFHLQYKEILDTFGVQLSSSYWALLTSKRGALKNTFYPTEKNIAEDKPIFEIEQGIGLVPSVHGIYLAILNSIESKLLESTFKQNYLSRRDNNLEEEVFDLVVNYFPKQAIIKRSVYETPHQSNEHDLIVIYNNTIYVFESKASPPVIPFRDPEKAFTRISRSFNSDTGIQKAYDQGLEIYKMWETKDKIQFFSKRGQLLVDVKSTDITNVYLCCITRDDFGMLGTNLSLLLKKQDSDPYPLVISVLDLYTLLDAWDYFNWGPDKLDEYINERITLHGLVHADDEMDYAGYYLNHGSFKYININKNNWVMLTPEYSNIFDQIYFSRNGGKQVIYDPKPPVTTNLSKEIEKLMSEKQDKTHNPRNKIVKQGRNEKCQCGSGLKFKKCCGKEF